MGTFVAFEAIHILAGNGYMEEYVVERLARDAKLIELGGGTTEIQILRSRELLRQTVSLARARCGPGPSEPCGAPFARAAPVTR
jgi:hypothetical protein